MFLVRGGKKDEGNREKIATRNEMLKLMNQDDDWFKNESSYRYRRIRELAAILEKSEQEKQLEKLNLEMFNIFRNQGFTLKEIAERLGISLSTLNKWKKKQEENTF